MNAFQVGGITLAVLLVAVTSLGVRRGRLSRTAAALWSMLWIAMGVFIAKPELTLIVARALGIARGADLVFYFGIVSMFVGFFAVLSRLHKIEENITLLSRHVALSEADSSPPNDVDSDG